MIIHFGVKVIFLYRSLILIIVKECSHTEVHLFITIGEIQQRWTP